MHRAAFTALLALTLAACSAGGDESAADGSADSAATAAAADTGAATEVPAGTQVMNGSGSPMTPDDVERYARGLDAELAAVQEAGRRMAQAKSGTDTLEVLGALQESATTDAGAKAAGVDVERYRQMRNAIGSAARALAPMEAEFPAEMLTTEMRAELQKGRDATLAQVAPLVPAATLEVIRPRAEAMRKRELELAGARLKAAGM